jgi:hypothetical protein
MRSAVSRLRRAPGVGWGLAAAAALALALFALWDVAWSGHPDQSAID